MVLKADKLSKSIKQQVIVDDLSLEVGSQEIVGLLGPNGAGKTTAFYLIMGLLKPDRGSVWFQGTNVTHLPLHRRAQMGIGYLAQEPSIFRGLTVEENLLCILELYEKCPDKKEARLQELLEELDLKRHAKKSALALSGGERRRLEITRALITSPKLLLLDEPFANIDPMTIADVKEMVRLLKSKGISILITDHNAREIFSIVDRSYLMIEGHILTSGTVELLTTDIQVRQLYLGHEFHF